MRVESIVLVTLALAGCAAPQVPPGFAMSWQQALHACDLIEPSIEQRLAQRSLSDPQFCVQSQQLGWQLQCLSNEVPALAAKHGSATPTSVLGLQSCLQPLAAGLAQGRTATSGEISLAIQQCVRPLEAASLAPSPPMDWSWSLVQRWLQVEAPTALPGRVELPLLAGMNWSGCEATRRLKPSAVGPAPGLPVLPSRPGLRTPAVDSPMLPAPPSFAF